MLWNDIRINYGDLIRLIIEELKVGRDTANKFHLISPSAGAYGTMVEVPWSRRRETVVTNIIVCKDSDCREQVLQSSGWDSSVIPHKRALSTPSQLFWRTPLIHPWHFSNEGWRLYPCEYTLGRTRYHTNVLQGMIFCSWQRSGLQQNLGRLWLLMWTEIACWWRPQ